MRLHLLRPASIAPWVTAALLLGCATGSVPPPATSGAVAAATPVTTAAAGQAATPGPAMTPAGSAANPASGAATSAPASAAASVTRASALVAPDAVPFDQSIGRAGGSLFEQAAARLGPEPRTLVIDPLIDANTGAQTVGTVDMGARLADQLVAHFHQWSIQPLSRAALADQPLLLIGTLTPVNVVRAIDTPPDAFRVWLTLIDLRSGKVVAKQIDRATVDSVNPEPLPFYRDSPTWHKDRTVAGYINSCQVNTNPGDPADPDYLARLPAAAVVNEAILAYGEGKLEQARGLYQQAAPLADPGDLRVLNGLYLTSWQLGHADEAKTAFTRLVDAGFDLKRLPMKLLFQPGTTDFFGAGDLPQQYRLWLASLAGEAGRVGACLRIVGHTSRTGNASANERLSRRRAEAVQRLLQHENRMLGSRLSASGVGSREALVGLGTDDARDALDRRVEFRVVDCAS